MAELGEANIGGRMVPAWLLNLTAKDLDGLKSRWYSNPNLLDNWYFGNPVNQRGQTEYTGNVYYIDRWRSWDGDSASLSVVSGGIKIAGTLYQYFESAVFEELWGKTITISLLLADGTPYTNSFALKRADWYTVHINAHGLKAIQFGINNNDFGNQNNNFLRISPATVGTLSDTILAAKLELGDTQTLAHKENGVWVLNEIPDFGEQLARCQRYFVNFNPYKMSYFAMPPAVASNAYQAYSAVTLPVAMRAQPVVTYGGNIALSQDADHAVTAIFVSYGTLTGNSIQLRYDVGAGTLTANSLYRVQGSNDPTSFIWLSADL